jgi:Resolvase, N terminal domain
MCDKFDDGAFSGASLDRPALQALLDQVRSQKNDIIVVAVSSFHRDPRRTFAACCMAAAIQLVPSREWLEFEGGVISSLFAQTETALSRRWRSRHESGYHKAAGGCS